MHRWYGTGITELQSRIYISQVRRTIYHVQNWNGYLWPACAAVCRVNKWFADDVLCSVKGEFLPKSDLSCWIDYICWMEWYPSITKTLLQPTLFQHRALARCWFRREKTRVVITGLHARWLVVIVNNGFPVNWSDKLPACTEEFADRTRGEVI